MAASIETNLAFLDACIADIQAKKIRLKALKKLKKPTKHKQLDLEDVIKEITDERLKK
jgi:hypothetical protein